LWNGRIPELLGSGDQVAGDVNCLLEEFFGSTGIEPGTEADHGFCVFAEPVKTATFPRCHQREQSLNLPPPGSFLTETFPLIDPAERPGLECIVKSRYAMLCSREMPRSYCSQSQ